MTRVERLAIFAVKHADLVRPTERAQLLLAAADYLPEEEADLCRSTAAFIQHAEDHQLKLVALFANK